MFEFPRAVLIEKGEGLAGYAPEYVVDEERQLQFVQWQEAGHLRQFEIAELLEATPEVFRFRDTEGGEWQLRELTLERYRDQVRHRTIGRPDFESVEEMLEAMRQEW